MGSEMCIRDSRYSVIEQQSEQNCEDEVGEEGEGEFVVEEVEVVGEEADSILVFLEKGWVSVIVFLVERLEHVSV